MLQHRKHLSASSHDDTAAKMELRVQLGAVRCCSFSFRWPFCYFRRTTPPPSSCAGWGGPGHEVSWSWVSGVGIAAGEHPSLHPANLRIVGFQFWKKKKSALGDFYLFIYLRASRASSREVLTAPHFCIFSSTGGEAQPETIHLLKKTEKVAYNVSLCWPKLCTVPAECDHNSFVSDFSLHVTSFLSNVAKQVLDRSQWCEHSETLKELNTSSFFFLFHLIAHIRTVQLFSVLDHVSDKLERKE